jgi:hypothetical protein
VGPALRLDLILSHCLHQLLMRSSKPAFDLERGHYHERGGGSLSSRRWLRRNSFWLLAIVTLCIMIILMRRFSSRHHSLVKSGLSDVGLCEERMLEAGWDKALPASQSRSLVYSKMQIGSSKRLSLGGIITQGLKQSDLFSFSVTRQQGGLSEKATVIISPILKSLEIPVRAIVAPLLDVQTTRRIKESVRASLMSSSSRFPEGSLFLQDDQLYHTALYHASSHMNPVKATSTEVEEEATAVANMASRTCPIQAILDRIILTPSGVVVACWQVLPSGSEPSDIRQELTKVLPNSPGKSGQTVQEPAMLHVTIARLLQPPEELGATVDEEAAVTAVSNLSEMLCGLKAEFDTLWFIEEQDLLALALRGRFVKHEAKLTCP